MCFSIFTFISLILNFSFYPAFEKIEIFIKTILAYAKIVNLFISYLFYILNMREPGCCSGTLFICWDDTCFVKTFLFWRDNSGIKSTSFSYRRPWLNFKKSHDSLQPRITSVPGNQISSFDHFEQQTYAWYIYIHAILSFHTKYTSKILSSICYIPNWKC